MAIFSNTKQTFAEKFDNIKSVFTTAYEQAKALKEEMQSEVNSKKIEIEILQNEIQKTQHTIDDASNFMEKIEDFI